ncbi:MAG: hypothetical protein EU551_02010 [Promethearchaeota archaeon]|nr:MAG: hypothetical protein EU551_02010 [Candidatus Lokiarchaeota archaeon]
MHTSLLNQNMELGYLEISHEDDRDRFKVVFIFGTQQDSLFQNYKRHNIESFLNFLEILDLIQLKLKFDTIQFLKESNDIEFKKEFYSLKEAEEFSKEVKNIQNLLKKFDPDIDKVDVPNFLLGEFL